MRIIIFFGLLLLFSCNRNEKITGKETELVFESNFNTLDLFAIDRDNRIVRHEHFTQDDLHDNTLRTDLPLGRYRVACVANCPDISFNTGETLENILLRLPKNGDTFQEANDIQTALQSVSISENKDAIFVIRLARRVTRLGSCLERHSRRCRSFEF